MGRGNKHWPSSVRILEMSGGGAKHCAVYSGHLIEHSRICPEVHSMSALPHAAISLGAENTSLFKASTEYPEIFACHSIHPSWTSGP